MKIINVQVLARRVRIMKRVRKSICDRCMSALMNGVRVRSAHVCSAGSHSANAICMLEPRATSEKSDLPFGSIAVAYVGAALPRALAGTGVCTGFWTVCSFACPLLLVHLPQLPGCFQVCLHLSHLAF